MDTSAELEHASAQSAGTVDVPADSEALRAERAARLAAEQRAERLSRLQRVTDSLSRTHRLEQAAKVVVEEGIAVLGARCGTLALLAEGGEDQVRLAYHAGYPPEFVDKWTWYPLSTALPSCDVIRTGEAIWLPSSADYHVRYPVLALYPELSAAVCAVPVELAGRPRAALVFGFDSPRPFEPDERAFITSLAQQGALAMERAYLFDATQQEIKQRSRAEVELAATLERFEEETRRKNALLATVPGIVWEMWDAPNSAAGRTNYISDYVETMLGYAVDTWLTVSDFSLSIIHPDDRDSVLRKAARAVKSGGTFTDRFRLVAKGGHQVWVEATAAVIRDEAGQPIGMRGVTVDITDRIRQEEAREFLTSAGELLGSSLDYEATLGQVVRLAVPHVADWCAVDILEDDGTVRLLAIGHVDPDKVKWAYTLRERYPVDMAAPTGMPNVLRTGRAEIYPDITDEALVIAAKDQDMLELLRTIGFRSVMIVPMNARGRSLGAITFVITNENPLRYDEEYLQLAQGLADRAALAVDNARLFQSAQNEIAERILTEADLRRSRNEIAVVLEGISDGITAQDPTGRVIYANTAAARISGFESVEEFLAAPVEQVVGMYQIFDESGRPFDPRRLPGRRALEGEDAPTATLRVRSNGTGEERWIEVKATPVRDASGGVVLAINFFRDVTERVAADQERALVHSQIEALNDQLRRAMTETHHRVKNNLQIMAAMVDMQAMEAGDTVPAKELSRLGAHIRTLAIIHELLTEKAKDDGRAESISARRVVEQLLSRVEGTIGDCKLTYKLADLDLPSRQSTSLALVVNELVSNAAKHGRAQIDVGFTVEDGQVRLQVTDDGPGFPPGFDANAAANTGLELVENLTRWDLSGTTNYRNITHGTGGQVEVRFPIPPACGL